jgi:hypothetical protein
MQPQQPPQLSPSPLPSNYLDQIASPQKQPGMSNKLFFLVIGGALILTIVIALALLSSAGGSKTISTERLALRLQTLQKISQDSHNTIKDSNLRSINSNLKTSLLNANRDITEPLKAAKIDLKKTDPKVTDEENGEAITKNLEEARLNGTFDRTYAKEISYQLETTTVLMNGLLKTTKSTSLKTFLSASLKDLTALQSQFSTYSSASS